MDAIKFALLCSHDRTKYPKMEEYWKKCQTTFPFTVYMGYFKEDINLKKFAIDNSIDIIVPQTKEDEKYNWLVVNHPIIVGKNFYFHFNPLEPISLNRILAKRRNSEWNDPRDNEQLNISKIMMGAKKVEHYQLPIEMKLQTGSLMTKDEKCIFLKNLIEELQEEANGELMEFRSIRNFNIE